jgi:hypothetical protein
MIDRNLHSHRVRLILDAVLVLLVVVAVFNYRQPRQVLAEQASHTQTALVNNPLSYELEMAGTTVITETKVASNTVVLDNETIAAMIAAENTALTPPQYMTSLPFLAR